MIEAIDPGEDPAALLFQLVAPRGAGFRRRPPSLRRALREDPAKPAPQLAQAGANLAQEAVRLGVRLIDAGFEIERELPGWGSRWGNGYPTFERAGIFGLRGKGGLRPS